MDKLEIAMHKNRLLKKLVRLHEEDPKDLKMIRHTEGLLEKYESKSQGNRTTRGASESAREENRFLRQVHDSRRPRNLR